MWQPIETAPKDGTRIWLFGGTLEGEVGEPWPNTEGTKAYWQEEQWYDAIGGKWTLTDTAGYAVWLWEPTHWMPLPDPPTT